MYENKSFEIRAYLLSLFLFKENLAEKEYFKRLYMLSNHTIQNYKVHKIRKRDGGYRSIYEPSPLLKQVQRRLLDTVLKEISVSKSATAYKKNISIIDNARSHVGKKKIVKLDIHHFYDSISFSMVYHYCFSFFPKKVGVLFTTLCCYADFLPQGAPTSSYISNIVMRDFDFIMEKYAIERHITYTRYSDDMTFSGDDFNHKKLILFVKEQLKRKGFFLNHKKTKVLYQNTSLHVTGLVVNEKINIEKKYLKKIRQEMHYITKYGIDSHLKRIGVFNKNEYLLCLMGKIRYIFSVTKKEEFLTYINLLNTLKKK